MIRTGAELLAEACRSDLAGSVNTSLAIREAEVELTSTLDCAEDVPMTPEMIPLVKKGDKFYVDFTSVYAAANDMGADIGSIMNAIVDINNDKSQNESGVEITPQNLVLMIESSEYFEELIEEAKKGDKKACNLLTKATDTIKSMKKAGINVQKKKSKGKKKPSSKKKSAGSRKKSDFRL